MGWGSGRDVGRKGQRGIRISVDAGRGGNVDNGAVLSILHAEVRSGGANEHKRRLSMEVHNSIPLLVGGFMDYAVPRKAGVVDNVVDLATSEFGGGGDDLLIVLSSA